MPYFPITQHAQASPCRCVTCQTNQGPFIDTGLDLVPYGHIYWCRMCVLDAALRFDGLHPEQAEQLRANVRTLETELETTRLRLVEESRNKVMTLETARELFLMNQPTTIPVTEVEREPVAAGAYTEPEPRRRGRRSK